MTKRDSQLRVRGATKMARGTSRIDPQIAGNGNIEAIHYETGNGNPHQGKMPDNRNDMQTHIYYSMNVH